MNKIFKPINIADSIMIYKPSQVSTSHKNSLKIKSGSNPQVKAFIICLFISNILTPLHK